MADAAMLARAPAAGLLQAGRTGRQSGVPGVTIRERPLLAAASVALRAGRRDVLAARLSERFGLALPQAPSRCAAGPVSLVWSGPSQWLAFDEARQGMDRFRFAPALAAAAGDAASVTELSGARAVFCIAGPDAQEALTRLVPIDLDLSVFPPRAAALTLAGHVGVTLWRREAGQGFDVCCYRSFAGSLAEALREAARPFGCLVVPPA